MIKQSIITHYRTEKAKAYRRIHGDRGGAAIRINTIVQVPIPGATASQP